MRTLQKVAHAAPVVLMLAWSSQAPAQNIDALDVTLPNCRDWLDVFDHKKAPEGTRTEGLNQGRCIGIVEGLFAADSQTCAPDGVNLAKSIRLVISYIDSLPEPRQDNFKALVLEAMRKAWPCKNN